MNEKKKVLKAATSLLSWLTGPIKCQKMVQNNNEVLKFPLFCPQLKRYPVHRHWGGTETRKYSHLRSCNRPNWTIDDQNRWGWIYQVTTNLSFDSFSAALMWWICPLQKVCPGYLLLNWLCLKAGRVLFVFGCRDTKTTNHKRHVIK